MKVSLFQGILMAAFGLGALLGLFVFATYTSNNTGSEGVGEVRIWGTLPKDGINELLTIATQTNADLKSVTYIEKDAASLPTQLASAIATGAAPDLILASQEQLLSLASYIQPIPLSSIPARTFASAFVDAGLIFTAPNGAGFYGVPFLVDPLVLYSNKTILSSSGIGRPPTTWEALTGLVPNIATLTPNRQITRGLIALGTYDNVTNARGILSAIFLQTRVPLTEYSSSGGVTANLGVSSESGVAPGSAVVTFYTQFADPSKVSYTWNGSLPSSQSSFVAGDIALYLGYASEAAFISSANPNLNFDISPLPQPGTATEKKTYGKVYGFMVPLGAANSAGAFGVAGLLTNDGEQALAAAATGLAPASLTALSAGTADPFASVAYQSALYVDAWLSPDPVSTDRIFSAMINNVVTGRSTVDTALSVAEHALGSLLSP